MTPEDYIPLCDALDWPEWGDEEEGYLEGLGYSRSTGWWLEWNDSAGDRQRGEQVAPHVALCILEKWFREKLDKRRIRIYRDDDPTSYWASRLVEHGPDLMLTVDGRWVEQAPGQWSATASFPTEAEAQIAALKTLKETDDGEADSCG